MSQWGRVPKAQKLNRNIVCNPCSYAIPRNVLMCFWDPSPIEQGERNDLMLI